MILKAAILTVSALLEKKRKAGDLIDDRYEILNFLGRGSYGYSYLVFDRKLGKRSVLKMLRYHKRTHSGKAAFMREITLLQSLKHPSFPAYFSHGDFEGIPYFTMEYVDGKTFDQLIFQEGTTYTEGETFQLGLELLSLIAVLHRSKIIHRDLRIPNIMMENEILRIIDFGLARRAGGDLRRTKDLRKEISPLSDYYSLGHFLLFLLYSGYNPPDDAKERPWEVELGILPESKTVIRKLLQVDEPYKSVQEIRMDLMRVIEKSKTMGGKENVVF